LKNALGTASSAFHTPPNRGRQTPRGEISDIAVNASWAFIESAKPKDEVECALLIQMACTHIDDVCRDCERNSPLKASAATPVTAGLRNPGRNATASKKRRAWQRIDIAGSFHAPMICAMLFPAMSTGKRARRTDADSRVDAYICHETIKPVARARFSIERTAMSDNPESSDERPCLHCLIADLIDEFYAEYGSSEGEKDTVDIDEILSALGKVIAEMTYGSDAAVRQRVLEDLTREVARFEEEYANSPASDVRH
jgi:hypothetical protein